MDNSRAAAFVAGDRIGRRLMGGRMAKEKEIKTNAMRILDKKKIPYDLLQYECDEFIDGLHTAQKTGVPLEQSFSRQYYVFVLPVAQEVRLKEAARLVGEKSLDMIHVKDITAVTGYVRGGCSPLGMKKQYPVFLHKSALDYEKIYISGGRIGTTLSVAAQDLLAVTGGRVGEF